MAVWSCAATGFEVNRDDLHPAGKLVSKALDLHLALEMGRVLRRLSLVPVDVIEKHVDLLSLTPSPPAQSGPRTAGTLSRANFNETPTREQQSRANFSETDR
jgi:hypothetical protein